MPVAAGVGIATAIAGIYGAHTQSDSTDKAATLKAKSDADALALATQQEATRKQEYDANLVLQKQQWDAQQQIRAPYRAAGANALSALGGILGVDFGANFTGPTPSTPSTFGTPSPTSRTFSGPDRTAQQNATQTTFDTGAQAVQDQIAQLPLAAGAPTSSTKSGGTPSPTDDAAILDQLQKNYAALGVTPTGPGSGPTDIQYYAGKVAETGGLTPDNIKFWFGPNGRIASDLAKAKGGTSATKTAQTSLGAPPSLGPALTTPLVGGINTPGYAPVIPISGLMGRGPYQ